MQKIGKFDVSQIILLSKKRLIPANYERLHRESKSLFILHVFHYFYDFIFTAAM